MFPFQGEDNSTRPPWTVENLEEITPPDPTTRSTDGRVLSGIKVLELCRIIAGPTIGRILAEYGADVLKITSPSLSDVPFFQVDGNMGKHAAELNLKTPEGRQIFDQLLVDADVILDGYRPGALEKLGYGPQAMVEIARRRGKGIVYVSENCFGQDGEWASRPGWQQIADCVSLRIPLSKIYTALRTGCVFQFFNINKPFAGTDLIGNSRLLELHGSKESSWVCASR